MPKRPRRSELCSAIVLLAISLVFAGCQTFVPRGHWEEYESEYFDYHVLVGDDTPEEEIEDALERLDAFWELVAGEWQYPEEKRILYYYFPSTAEVGRLTGEAASNRAVVPERIVHSVQLADTQRIANILTMYPLLNPDNPARLYVSMFWLEGIALYYAWPEVYYGAEALEPDRPGRVGRWKGYTVHAYAKEWMNQDELIELDRMISDNVAFRRNHVDIVYPQSGSFVTFLLGEGHQNPEAIEQFREFIYLVNEHAESAAEVRTVFESVFGRCLDEVEREWRAFLSDWEEDFDEELSIEKLYRGG